MTAPKVSIIVPLYNKVNEVERAIDSIFAQTVQDFELIVIDGGSTDGSLDVIKKYENDKRYHLIHQKSKGLPAARNEAIAVSKSDMVAFLDADDEWLPDFLEKIVVLKNKYPDAGLYATLYLICQIDHFIPRKIHGLNSDDEYMILPSYFKTAALSGTPFCPSSVAIPKYTFKKVGLFNPSLTIGEDTEMWGRIAMELDIAYCTTPHTIYNLIASNKMTDDCTEIKHLPFWEYISQLPKSELDKYDKLDDLYLYLEADERHLARHNICAGNPSLAKDNLKNIKSQYFNKDVRKYSIIANMPFNLGKNVIVIQ